MARQRLHLLGEERQPEGHGTYLLRLQTDGGAIDCRFHDALAVDSAVLWVFGSGGGLGGPAGGVYTRLGARLRQEGVSSLELSYRRPGHLEDCVADVLAGIDWLAEQGQRRIILVGHSFGGAVVINAAAASPEVIAVAALSSQTAGTGAVSRLGARPLLLAHGEEDEILPSDCSTDLFQRATGPKELILYPGCRHGLDQCREELDRDLLDWLERNLAAAGASNRSTEEK